MDAHPAEGERIVCGVGIVGGGDDIQCGAERPEGAGVERAGTKQPDAPAEGGPEWEVEHLPPTNRVDARRDARGERGAPEAAERPMRALAKADALPPPGDGEEAELTADARSREEAADVPREEAAPKEAAEVDHGAPAWVWRRAEAKRAVDRGCMGGCPPSSRLRGAIVAAVLREFER